jgi:hypothetical protein
VALPVQVALSGDGQLLIVHAPLPYVRAYSQPANAQADAVYTYKLVRWPCCLSHYCVTAELQV